MTRRGPSSQAVSGRTRSHWLNTTNPGPAPVVFGTGLIALDIILSAYPDRGPKLAAGGTCGNVLTALSFLGWEAFPVARLNGDVASELVSADLARWGVALDFAMQTPSAPTPIILQRNDRGRDGKPRHRFSIACPACGAWYPSFRAVTIEGAESVIEAIGDASHAGFAPQVFFFDRVSRGALLLAEWFAGHGALVVFEPVGVGDPRLFAEALSVAHVLKYSRERLPDLSRASRLGSGVLVEIETIGDSGLRYRSRRSQASWNQLEAIRTPKVVDTAGAGDWCTAAFLATTATGGLETFGQLSVRDIADALRVGQAAATVACEYEGARGAMDDMNRAAFTARVELLQSLKFVHKKPGQQFSDESRANAGRVSTALLSAQLLGVESVCPACT
jgi:sugar/nucleoside kinase (ribokinase family)